VFVRQKSQRSTWPEIFPFAARPYAERPKGERIRDELGSEKGSKPKGRLKSAWRFLRRILKLALAALSISTLVLVGGPSFISLPVGLNAVLYLMNVVIPGSSSIPGEFGSFPCCKIDDTWLVMTLERDAFGCPSNRIDSFCDSDER
jgi:hypothetical protein